MKSFTFMFGVEKRGLNNLFYTSVYDVKIGPLFFVIGVEK